MSIEELKSILRKYNFSPNFTYGQNFLLDEEVLGSMLDAASVTAGDMVLEVGPGIGNLTRALLGRGAKVLAIEKDPKFLPILKAIKKEFPTTFRYEIADILEYDFSQQLRSGPTESSGPTENYRNKNPQVSENPDVIRRSGSGYKVVANIPYYITGKILQLFLTAQFKPQSVTVLIQKEVAENATAQVGELSVLSLSVQLYGEPRLVQVVPRESFYPAPKVDSAVLHVTVFPKPKYPVDEKKFFGLVRACFAGKRKQIHNTLTNNYKLPKDRVLKILADVDIDIKTRPQDLSLEQWAALLEKLN